MSVAKDIAGYLDTNGVGTLTEDIFAHQLPAKNSTPISGTVVIPTGGGPSDEGCGVEVHTYQITSRFPNPEDAYNKAYEVFGLLDNLRSELVAGRMWADVIALQPPFFQGRTASDQFIFGANYQFWLSE